MQKTKYIYVPLFVDTSVAVAFSVLAPCIMRFSYVCTVHNEVLAPCRMRFSYVCTTAGSFSCNSICERGALTWRRRRCRGRSRGRGSDRGRCQRGWSRLCRKYGRDHGNEENTGMQWRERGSIKRDVQQSTRLGVNVKAAHTAVLLSVRPIHNDNNNNTLVLAACP